MVWSCEPTTNGCDYDDSGTSSDAGQDTDPDQTSPYNFAINGGVEDGLTNWSTTCGTLTRTTADKHSGSASAVITGRTANWHGATFNVGSLT